MMLRDDREKAVRERLAIGTKKLPALEILDTVQV